MLKLRAGPSVTWAVVQLCMALSSLAYFDDRPTPAWAVMAGSPAGQTTPTVAVTGTSPAATAASPLLESPALP
eukprot:10505007-Prorocentrum_lima.AAC.1